MRPLYSFSIFIYGLAIRSAALFNAKARLWIAGRNGWEEQLRQKIGSGSKPLIWFHCASLGEFEQGRPIIERIKKKHPNHFIVLSFYSPSGYEVRKHYAVVDHVTYLPLDTPANARKFIEIIKPQLAVFVKYEFWLNYLAELRKKNIPHLLIAAIFRSSQIFFKFYGGIFRDALKGYTNVFVQDTTSQNLLQTVGCNSIAAGDPRFDRVADIAANAQSIPIADTFAENKEPILVAGSTWPADEELLFPILAEYIENHWKLIIAPHELGEAHLQSIEEKLTTCGIARNAIVRFSQTSTTEAQLSRVLVIDNIGMLSSLYRYGQLAYIGGGFGKSIHNTLEAAVYDIPVVFGPAHEKFNEARELIKYGGGRAVMDAAQLREQLTLLLTDATKREAAGKAAGKYVSDHLGATEVISAVIDELMHKRER